MPTTLRNGLGNPPHSLGRRAQGSTRLRRPPARHLLPSRSGRQIVVRFDHRRRM